MAYGVKDSPAQIILTDKMKFHEKYCFCVKLPETSPTKITDIFHGLRKFSVGQKYLNIGGFDSGQGAKHAKLGGQT
jgi:hypothetical protein